MFTVWRMSVFGAQIGAEISTRLYRHYMYQPWLFHASGSSSQLTNLIAQEANRVTKQVIEPLMQMNAKGVMALVMASGIFIFNPIVAVTGILIFLIAYFILFKTVRNVLAKNGMIVTRSNQIRYKLMSEGFGGIKDTLLLGRQEDFNQRYALASKKQGQAQSTTRTLTQAPRYLMELVAFGVVVFLILYLLTVYNGDLGQILPVLSVYALAGFKLLPAFQNIYASIAQVKSNIVAFDNIEQDLKASHADASKELKKIDSRLSVKQKIQLDGVSFTYPGKSEKALNNLSIEIPVNHVVGLVGASGSGKSTAIDILLGLITPQEGNLKIDGIPLKGDTLRAWQNNVGYVPQSIFLADASIKENIAFGIPPDEIDIQRVKKAAKMAHLEELLEQLPEGLNTRVGERGVQLSGGQRQRIGIARALYDDAEILVLDEATSALDGITEKLVMDAIHDFAGKKTIVMIAHRLATVKACNTIYMLDNGAVVDKGVFVELTNRNNNFKSMADHS